MIMPSAALAGKGFSGPAQAGLGPWLLAGRARRAEQRRLALPAGVGAEDFSSDRCASRSRKFWWLSTWRQAIRCTIPGFSWSRYQLIRFSGSSRSISILAARSLRWTSASATVIPRASAVGLRTALRRGRRRLADKMAEIVEPHVPRDGDDRDRLVPRRGLAGLRLLTRLVERDEIVFEVEAGAARRGRRRSSRRGAGASPCRAASAPCRGCASAAARSCCRGRQGAAISRSASSAPAGRARRGWSASYVAAPPFQWGLPRTGRRQARRGGQSHSRGNLLRKPVSSPLSSLSL